MRALLSQDLYRALSTPQVTIPKEDLDALLVERQQNYDRIETLEAAVREALHFENNLRATGSPGQMPEATHFKLTALVRR